MLGRRHVAQEVGAGAGGDGATDGGGDVVVSHTDIGHQRPEHIERGVVAQALLQFHIGGDLVERHVGPVPATMTWTPAAHARLHSLPSSIISAVSVASLES